MNRNSNLYTGKYISVDGRLIRGQDFDWEGIGNTRSAYEVLRVMKGKPLFLEDHLKRLEESMKFLNLTSSISRREIALKILELSLRNSISTGNVKLIYSRGITKTTNDQPKLLIAFVPHKYPSAEETNAGITMKTLQLERPNPNAKVIHQTINDKVNRLKAQSGFDEILLVNHDGIMTEGSKSNIFFIQHNNIFTAGISLVLAGITRKKVIDLCFEHGFELREGKPSVDILGNIKGAFITGTSPKVMPVRQIDNYTFSTNSSLIKQLRKLYDEKIDDYLKKFSIDNPTG